MSLLFSSLIIKFIRIDLELRVLASRKKQNKEKSLDTFCKDTIVAFKDCVSLLESKDDNLGAVIGPLTDSEVQVAIDFLSSKQPNMMDLKKIHTCIHKSF